MRPNSHEHHVWLEKTDILDIANANSIQFQRILKNCLKITKETVLIIGDKGYQNRRLSAVMAAGYYLGAKKLGYNAELVLQEPKNKGQKADSVVIESLSNLKPGSVIILALSGRLGGTGAIGKSYRKLSKEMGHRFISASNLGVLNTNLYPALIDCVDVNYNRMSRKGQRLKEILDDANEVHITTKKGTDIYFNIQGREAIVNDGFFSEPGTGGNLPAGEVYIAPKGKEKINGKIVIDGSSAYKGGTMLIKEPITIEVTNGSVVDVYGGKEAAALRATLEWAAKKSIYTWGIKRIGELGIGINQNAKVIGATIIDEKSLGTAHVGIGSNYWFGGTIYAISHFDQIFNSPTIHVDGELLNVSAI